MKLRHGRLNDADAKAFEQIPASEFISDLRVDFPVVFQERIVHRKHEIGLARTVVFRPKVRVLSEMPILYFVPVLVKCVLVSSYNDAISEVTRYPFISVEPTDSKEISLETASGNKLDKTPDGWRVHPLKRRTVRLTKEFLLKRGWTFNPLFPGSAP
jgi:hypothetical protein